MKKLNLVIAIILGLVLSAIFAACFAWIFWLLGADNITTKFNTFMDALIFNKN